MSTTQFYALVLFYLGYIFLMQPYSTDSLRNTYLQNQSIVNETVTSPQIGVIIDQSQPHLGEIIITDPDAVW
jgi:hypothetical protein